MAIRSTEHFKRFRRTAAIVLVGALQGCATTARPPQPVDMGRFGKGYRFTNGTVEVVIVPQLGRVMRFGYVGGPNLLYSISASDMPPSGYVNWGGDKAWIWPQADWAEMIGHRWPPPPAADGLAWTLDVQSERSCRLTSGVIEPWGVRLERQMILDPNAATVHWVNRLMKAAGDGKKAPTTRPTAAWSVTQVRVPSEISAHLQSATADGLQYTDLFPQQFAAIERNGERLMFTRNLTDAAKVGLDADALSVVVGATRFTQTLESFAPPTGYRPNEKAQIYAMPDPGPSGAPKAYVELEFTSPPVDLTAVPETRTAVRWDLSPATGR